MSEDQFDKEALARAFEVFNKTTKSMEEAYRSLDVRVRELDAELAAKNQELALTSDYLNSLLDSMSDGVIAVDNAGVIMTFNAAASLVLGYTAEQAIGRSFMDLFGRDFDVPQGPQLTELRAHNGEACPVSERNSPLADSSGLVLGSVKVFQDLSEIEALRERVRQKDRLAAIGEMAATVAHEIRNPLGGIRGFAALLRRDIDDDDPRGRLVNKVLDGATALDRVVGELLEYTRPLELHPRSTNCADLLEAAMGYVELGSKDIAVERSLDPDVHLYVDPDKIRQVFLNVLLNAVQSIESAGQITLKTQVNGERATVVIGDTGGGMTAEQAEKACRPFFTTKEKGTGLGLAVASKIVQAHGGTLDIESAVGQGSTLSIGLPKAT
jgi:PAS domain S-box-containing protein